MTNLAPQISDRGGFAVRLSRSQKAAGCKSALDCNETEKSHADVACTGTLGFRERQNERLHKQGATAFGYFQVYKPLSTYTCARFLQDPSQKVPVFVHFVRSAPRLADNMLVAARGAHVISCPDVTNSAGGFAVRFYTEHGLFDWLDASVAWDLADDSNRSTSKRIQLAQRQEALALINDQAPSANVATQAWAQEVVETAGHGQIYRLIDSSGNVCLAKTWWKFIGFSRGGSSQADKLVQRSGDMCLAIDAGLAPQYELYMQLVQQPTAMQAVAIGKMVLDRGVQRWMDNADEETELMPLQISNVVPGIEATRQAVLKQRFFAALKQRLSRADKKRPAKKVAKTWRLLDSGSRSFFGSTEASSLVSRKSAELCACRPLLAAHNLGLFAGRLQPERTSPEAVLLSFTQGPRELYHSLSLADREELIGACLYALMNIEQASLREQILAQCCEIDFQLGHALATGLGLEFPPAQQFNNLAAQGYGSCVPAKAFALTSRRS